MKSFFSLSLSLLNTNFQVSISMKGGSFFFEESFYLGWAVIIISYFFFYKSEEIMKRFYRSSNFSSFNYFYKNELMVERGDQSIKKISNQAEKVKMGKISNNYVIQLLFFIKIYLPIEYILYIAIQT